MTNTSRPLPCFIFVYYFIISFNMIILAIETSCDETAIAVLKADKKKFEILSNIVASQIKIHAPWGGVVPNLAKREHERNLPIVLNKALKKAGFVNPKSQISNLKNIDLMAVTIGPGLEPSLWVGINFAKDLAEKWKKPLIGINHMEGHIFSALLKKNLKSQISNLKNLFPILALLVSGGHTELVLINNWLKYKVIGQTRDDAAGEAFDKVAKMLGLPYPGGPEIAAKAAQNLKSQISNLKINLPRPMINSKDYDFSFSGLKTAVLYLLRDLRAGKFGSRIISLDARDKGNQFHGLIPQICHEFQQAVIDVLIKKTVRAANEYKAKTVILGGGVAANKELRKQLGNKTNLLLPEIKFTTDNAAMIAVAAYFHALKSGIKKKNWKNLQANGNLKL